ncbi:MAG: thiamine-binding protein, partial [candidate division Zixibacteria bacterium]|nr:thiamine-binding protein [candidate division Zixibacteria bacterium]
MLVFFSISPLGTSESVSKPVSEIIDIIARSGLEYQVTPMGTIFEGSR